MDLASSTKPLALRWKVPVGIVAAIVALVLLLAVIAVASTRTSVDQGPGKPAPALNDRYDTYHSIPKV
jgi:hypothetical protein